MMSSKRLALPVQYISIKCSTIVSRADTCYFVVLLFFRAEQCTTIAQVAHLTLRFSVKFFVLAQLALRFFISAA